MKKLLITIILSCLALGAFADGTVTAPVTVTPSAWKIQSINLTTGAGSDVPEITITIWYFDGSGAQIPNLTQSIVLTGAEITSFLTTVESPTAGESGSVVKKYRQRVTAWLLANGKIANVTPE